MKPIEHSNQIQFHLATGQSGQVIGASDYHPLWTSVKDALPDPFKGKILVTQRVERAADNVCLVDKIEQYGEGYHGANSVGLTDHTTVAISYITHWRYALPEFAYRDEILP